MLTVPLCEYDWFVRAGFGYPAVLSAALFGIFAYGACLGSFINVCIWRIPRGESVAGASSHCTACGAPIHWYDNIPVVSFLVLRGRCRACRAPYSPRYFIVEVLCGLLFCAVFLKTGLLREVPGSIAASLVAVLYIVGSGWIDAEHRIIPDLLSYPAMALGVVFSAVFPEVWGSKVFWAGALSAALSGVAAAVIPAIFALTGEYVFKKELLGWGDVKFVSAIGVLLGFSGAVWTLFAGSWLGLIYGLTMLICRRNLKKLPQAAIPFGPFLGAAALLWIFFSRPLVAVFCMLK